MPAAILCLLCVLSSVAGTRAAEPTSGPATTTASMLVLDNGVIRVGVDPSLGGAITLLSRSGPESENLVNNHDWGRQIQMSHYSGPVPFAPDGHRPMPAWAGLGWNPVQSGDCYGHRSRTLEARSDGHTLFTRSIPMQWPLNNVPSKCVFETTVTLDNHAVRVHCRIVNHRSDHRQYPARNQELPAVYTIGKLYRLMTYTGPTPFTSAKLERIAQHPDARPNFPRWSSFTATENWAALVNDDGFGVGVWNASTYGFAGGFYLTEGVGGTHDDPTGYVSPTRAEILDHDIDYSYDYTLIVGTLDEIRAYVYDHARRPGPPSYRCRDDRQGWIYHDARDAGMPIKGELQISVDGEDPQLIGPAGFWKAADARTLYIEAAVSASSPRGQVFWSRFDAPGFSADRAADVSWKSDGQYHLYRVELGQSAGYRGIITGLRLDPVNGRDDAAAFRIRSIGFSPPNANSGREN